MSEASSIINDTIEVALRPNTNKSRLPVVLCEYFFFATRLVPNDSFK